MPALGLVESVNELYPGAQWQRCAVHVYRNVFSHVPNAKVAEVAARQSERADTDLQIY